MERLFLILCFVLSSIFVYSQTIRGTITDATTKMPLISVNITIDGSIIGTTTDEKGNFELKIEKLPVVMTVSYLGYERKKITISTFNTSKYSIALQPKISNLPEVSVSATPKVDTVYASKYSVIDYEFYGEYILLLAYKNAFAKHILLLIDEEGNEINEISLRDKTPTQLYKSCLGGVYLFTTISAYQIYLDEHLALNFANQVSIFSFEASFNNCIGANNDFVYFYNTRFQNQQVEYYAFAKTGDLKRQHITSVIDERKVELLLDEAHFQSLKSILAAAHASGVVDEVSDKNLFKTPVDVATEDLQFISQVIYKPIYAPLFITNEHIFLFNHVDSFFIKMTPEGIIKSYTPITYTNDKKWKHIILFDEITEKAYTLFDTQWHMGIRAIDMKDGTLSTMIPIERDFVEKIKIRDGFMYFLYRDFKTTDHLRKLEKVKVY